MIKQQVLTWIVWLFYKTLITFWRQRLITSDAYKEDLSEGRPIIFAMWHGDELGAISFSRFFKLATLTSTSKDGELMNGVLLKLGFQTARGSSTRGGATALKGLVRLGRKGNIIVVPVDGPKGPIHKAKPGVFELSRLLGARIFPIRIVATRKFVFEKSWNKAFLPLPFSKVLMLVDTPLEAVSKSDDPRNPELAKRLEKALDATGKQAAKLIDSQIPQ